MICSRIFEVKFFRNFDRKRGRIRDFKGEEMGKECETTIRHRRWEWRIIPSEYPKERTKWLNRSMTTRKQTMVHRDCQSCLCKLQIKWEVKMEEPEGNWYDFHCSLSFDGMETHNNQLTWQFRSVLERCRSARGVAHLPRPLSLSNLPL